MRVITGCELSGANESAGPELSERSILRFPSRDAEHELPRPVLRVYDPTPMEPPLLRVVAF